jgi:hypothetical protein
MALSDDEAVPAAKIARFLAILRNRLANVGAPLGRVFANTVFRVVPGMKDVGVPKPIDSV